MMIGTQEHYDLMAAFERDHRGYRLDREAKDLWPKGNVYQNGETNALFLAYRNGASFAKAYHRDDSSTPANPARVTDEMVEVAIDAWENVYEAELYLGSPTYTDNKEVAMRAALTAAIGAGGQAVKPEPDFAASIAGVIKEESDGGAACGWKACSGCHETNEGTETGHYPYSKTFGCYVGSGCSECGGLGVVWEHWSDDALKMMATDVSGPAHPAPSGQVVAVKPLDLSNLLKHAFSAGYVSAAGDDGWTDYDPTKCAAYSRILSAIAHPVQPAWRECATDGCVSPATIHFVRGGVGSYYCYSCYCKIQALPVGRAALADGGRDAG